MILIYLVYALSFLVFRRPQSRPRVEAAAAAADTVESNEIVEAKEAEPSTTQRSRGLLAQRRTRFRPRRPARDGGDIQCCREVSHQGTFS